MTPKWTTGCYVQRDPETNLTETVTSTVGLNLPLRSLTPKPENYVRYTVR